MPGARALPSGRCALIRGLAALLLVCAFGCAGALGKTTTPAADAPSLRIADADFGRDPRVVSASDALEDLELLIYAFDAAYAGNYNDAKAIAQTRSQLASRPEWPPFDLAHELCDLFRRPDGHLSFGYDGRTPLRLFAVPPRPGSVESPSAPPLELTDGPVPVLAIRSFDNAAEPSLVALPALARRLRSAPQFVVDLRGNAGGNYTFAEQFVLELTDGELRRLDEREVVSVAAAEGRANSVRRRLEQGDVPAAALPHFLAQLRALDELAARLHAQGAPRADLVTTGAKVRGRAPGPLRSRAVFLVDGGCASACEMLISLARQIPGVLVAGQHTRGGMAFGELAMFRLPHSGVVVSMGTRAFTDPFGDFVETRGFSPDVFLAPESALVEAKRIATAVWESPLYAHHSARARASSRLFQER